MREANSGPAGVWGVVGVVVLVFLLGLGLWRSESWSELWSTMRGLEPSRQVRGEVFGAMPRPTQPQLPGPVLEMVTPPSRLTQVLVKRIPSIDPGARMPHPSWGPCTNCHLIRGGLPPGSQPATPVAKVWEQVSAYYKVGPPILPNSARPHPPSGRCIKCHDVLVSVQTR
ncbi:MAG: magnetochrome domain-containing protein [Magnetococcales bacterium]|nr:magnetochrome domain-containing protein [Magnetococcales bacterium]MBF0155724.1 magnetochrome domain-containing protein [Magnetococcales bacterium]